MSGDVQLVLPAAGSGVRLGHACPKALVPIAGIALLVHTLNRFAPLNLIERAVVLHPPQYEAGFRNALKEAFPHAAFTLAPGGRERQDSVRLGLDLVAETTRYVILHDAARPFVETSIINAAVRAAQIHGGATAAVPAIDTILRGDADDLLEDTPDRDRLWACQTPQVFELESIRAAHARAREQGRRFTDDATLFKHYGGRVKIVHGSPENRKITTQDDLDYAEYRLAHARTHDG